MLSRLKRRTPPVNSAVDDSPDPSNHPSVVTEFGRAVSPSPSRRPQAATAPSRGSSYVDPDAPNPYGLSPERARSRTSRSSSFSSAGAGDRRSANYSMPEPRSLAVGRGGLIGEGSLKLDQISSGGGGATLLVQAPELMLALGDLEPNGYHSESDLRTPVPGLNGVNAFDIFPPTSPPITRARSATTASQRPSGLDALADINVPSTPSFASALATPHDPHTADRSRSRTSSFTNGERPALASPTITTTTSASSSRKSTLVQPDSYSNSKNSNKKSRSSTGGIASALALSGVTLASPSAQLRQPLALARVPTSTSSLGGRDSQDGVDSDGMSFGEQGFMSMDALGNFDDVVDQLGTGYAVASSKRNAEFHAIFKTIPDDDYLIEDYGCALQREILIQGRLYISEHHLSFNANIFGWVTTLTLPFAEIVSIEKRMTAYVIPNAIQVTTLHARYSMTSFLSRDTTYDLIVSIWRMIHPSVPVSALPDGGSVQDTEDDADIGSMESVDEVEVSAKRNRKRTRGRRRGEASEGGTAGEKNGLLTRAATGSPRGSRSDLKMHPPTIDACPAMRNLKETCMDVVFPSAPEKIYNLMFTSGFMREFWISNQKLMELQISDWAPEKSGSNLLARTMSYIKPLNGSIGPKQTKCLLTDENAHVDFDDYVCVITTTRTPDVPSGSAFAVRTRTSMTWAKGNSCRVVVTTGVEWSKSSFIKGIIERSCIEGQKSYHADLEKAMRAYIHQHRSEFLEEGQAADVDLSDEEASVEEGGWTPDATAGGAEASSVRAEDAGAFGALTRAFPLLQPVVDIFSSVGELVGGLIGGLSLTSGAITFVIGLLLLSNLWTLSRRPATPSRARLDHASSTPSSHRTPDEVADAVRDVLQDYFALKTPLPPPPRAAAPVTPSEEAVVDPAIEAKELAGLLDELEGRLARLRRSLSELD